MRARLFGAVLACALLVCLNGCGRNTSRPATDTGTAEDWAATFCANYGVLIRGRDGLRTAGPR